MNTIDLPHLPTGNLYIYLRNRQGTLPKGLMKEQNFSPVNLSSVSTVSPEYSHVLRNQFKKKQANLLFIPNFASAEKVILRLYFLKLRVSASLLLYFV